MNREENSDKWSTDLYNDVQTIVTNWTRMESSTDIKSEHIIIGIGTI